MKFSLHIIPVLLFPVSLTALSSAGSGISAHGRGAVDASVLGGYPQPQLQRKSWASLNGFWNHLIVPKDEAMLVDKAGAKLVADKKETPWSKIFVPYCPESSLSGVSRLIQSDQALWYQRKLEVKPVGGERTLLHFGAVDHETVVRVNGKEMGKHVGGHTPFSFDITGALADDGINTLTVRVHDATEGWQLRGKQSLTPKGIAYTRVTGIWQTVWMEQVPERHVEDLDYETLVGNENAGTVPSLLVKARLSGPALAGESLRVAVSSEGREVVTAKGEPGKLLIGIPDAKWWTPDTPHLYDLTVELLDGAGKVIDSVQSYTALRTVGKVRDERGHLKVALNGKEIFLMGPLDQGWWPDGLLTPPSEEAMIADLKFIKAAGFNMVRKHVKVEPSRYYYHCDRLGLAVWQDQVSAGMWEKDEPKGASPPWTRLQPNPKDANWPEEAHQQWVKEYKEMVDALRDHPSILIWCPFNESWGQHNSMEIGKMAKEYDPTRLVCLASGGNFWPMGDIASHHNYPDPHFPVDDPRFKDYIKVVGEMGGHGWAVEGHQWKSENKNWSYTMPNTLDEWKTRYEWTMRKMKDLREAGVSIGVYTQTSDVETEVNGLLTYDRVPKVDAAWLKKINDKVMLERAAPQGIRGTQPKRSTSQK